jgi:hypothetical protein
MKLGKVLGELIVIFVRIDLYLMWELLIVMLLELLISHELE